MAIEKEKLTQVTRPHLYGLLFIDGEENSHVNLKGPSDTIDIYLRCSALCALSCQSAGSPYTLVTNRPDLLQERLDRLGSTWLNVRGYEFRSEIPKGVPFYSAHFKLEIIRAFGSGELGDHVGLIDLDTVFLRELPPINSLSGYDISDQVIPAYGANRIAADLELVAGRRLTSHKWYGGEFLAGTSTEFSILAELLQSCWTRYLESLSKLHHVGDEMIMSAVLNMAGEDGLRILDFGASGHVARWWTARTRNEQAPFDALKGAALLHLPSDKEFLARQVNKQFDPQVLLARYRWYARRKLFVRSLAGAADRLLGRPRKFTPRLSLSRSSR